MRRKKTDFTDYLIIEETTCGPAVAAEHQPNAWAAATASRGIFSGQLPSREAVFSRADLGGPPPTLLHRARQARNLNFDKAAAPSKNSHPKTEETLTRPSHVIPPSNHPIMSARQSSIGPGAVHVGIANTLGQPANQHILGDVGSPDPDERIIVHANDRRSMSTAPPWIPSPPLSPSSPLPFPAPNCMSKASRTSCARAIDMSTAVC